MQRSCRATLVGALTAGALIAVPGARAMEPGRGLTGPFEVEFMQTTMDHHFAALRMTELAAGTDTQRNGQLTSQEGRMQREEIMTLQRFLRDWYDIDHQPQVSASNRALIEVLERARPGADFDHAFLEAISRHHYTLMEPVNGCMAGSELRHFDLRRECNGMWHSQIADIGMMRHELESHFSIADYQPFNDRQPLHSRGGNPRGQHSGSEPR